MADDHIHLAVASDGTLYAAVKTSYDSSGYPRMCLLVRRPSGVWDNLYQVDTIGTRPIVMINEAAGKLIVAYTQSDSGGNIYFKESPLQQHFVWLAADADLRLGEQRLQRQRRRLPTKSWRSPAAAVKPRPRCSASTGPIGYPPPPNQPGAQRQRRTRSDDISWRPAPP